MELDFSQRLQADRSGPKSAAQTPAKKEERKKGSSVNEPGSAAGSQSRRGLGRGRPVLHQQWV